jgi:hypothetical protein
MKKPLKPITEGSTRGSVKDGAVKTPNKMVRPIAPPPAPKKKS